MRRVAYDEQAPRPERRGDLLAHPPNRTIEKGDFEVGIQQTNVMHGVSGSDYVGNIPAAIDQPCQINVGVLAASKQPDVAREMIKFMTSLDAYSWLQKGHLEPFRRGS